jgi:hypothetical protein
MLRDFINCDIEQITSFSYSNESGSIQSVSRNRKIPVDFVSELEICKGWEEHTDSCTLSFPKNVILINEDGYLFKQHGTYNVILGGSDINYKDTKGEKNSAAPLLMRGDKITVNCGILYQDYNGKTQRVESQRFNGFITKIHSEIPIKIECEDNFYLLKRTPVNKSIHKGSLVELCDYMLSECNKLFGLNNSLAQNGINPYPILKMSKITDSITANFSLGYLDIGDITCAELLSRLRKQYNFESFFIGDELHFGFPIYDESKANSKNIFEFENNIHPDHSLEYTSKEDIILSAVVSCKVFKETNRTTKDGQTATKRERLSVLIYWDIPTQTFKYIQKKKGEPFPSNEGGERHEFIYPIDPAKGEPPVSDLVEFGKKQLEKYYYTGFRGSFKTFMFPFVNWGDNVNLLSTILTDRNGRYKVKKVVISGSMQGLHQEIHLDYKLNEELPTNFIETSLG